MIASSYLSTFECLRTEGPLHLGDLVSVVDHAPGQLTAHVLHRHVEQRPQVVPAADVLSQAPLLIQKGI